MTCAADFECEIEENVLEHFLATGQAATVADIAKIGGRSPSTVRKYLPDARLTWTKREVEVRERSYGTIRAHRQVVAFLPTLTHLRAEILNLRNG